MYNVGVYLGICLPTYLGWYMSPYHASLLYHPGYTMVHTVPGVLPGTLSPVCAVSGNEALGSTLGLIREERLLRAFLLSDVLRLEETSAQSYSLSPGTVMSKIG